MDCIFFEIAAGNIPAKKVFEDDDVIAFLDVNPASFGHTLVVPKQHVRNFMEADAATIGKVFGVASALGRVLQEKLGASGMNLLSNAGESAGQTVDHFHIHLIPRYDDRTQETLTLEFGPMDLDLDQVLAKIQH